MPPAFLTRGPHLQYNEQLRRSPFADLEKKPFSLPSPNPSPFQSPHLAAAEKPATQGSIRAHRSVSGVS
ncbi:unnamed protein product [Urochloa humidicola]